MRRLVPAAVVTLLLTAQAALSGEVVILDGPRAAAWRQAIGESAKIVKARSIKDVPEQATLVIPDRLLTAEELAQLKQLPASVRLLAMGRSAYSESKSSAAEVLGVGKHFQYIPLLYPKWLDYDMKRYEEIARWSAEQGAQGIGVFSYMHTLPNASDQANFETIRDVFGSYESWKTPPSMEGPRSPGLKRTPLVVFMHKNDTQKAGPEEAVEWAQQLNANTISIEVSRFRTRGVYPSQFTQEGEHEYQGRMVKPDNDLDYLPRMLAAAEEAGIAIHANLMTKHTPHTTEPHERQVMSSDYGSEEAPPREAPCPISGARHYDDMAAIAEELLRLYPKVAAIELDEPRIYNSKWTDWACFCEGCGKVFKERYGYELTPANVIDYPQFEDSEPDERRKHTTEGGHQTINADFQTFRTWMMNDLILEKFRRAMNRVRPGAALVVWQPRTYEAFGFSPDAIMHGVNVFGPEYMDGPGSPRYLNHPDNFYPRMETIVRMVDARSDEENPLKAEITRVDLFDQAQPLLWGEAQDESRWVLLSSAKQGRVMYVAYDPISGGTQNNKVLDQILDWIRN